MVVDGQVHIWGRSSTEFPWAPGSLDQLPSKLVQVYLDRDRTAEDLLDDMDASRVDIAILTSPLLYGADPAYCLAAADRHPGRFAVVAPVGLHAGSIADQVRRLSSHSNMVGIRLLLDIPDRRRAGTAAVDALDAALAAADAADLPVFISPMGHHDVVAGAASRFPRVPLVLDHLGLWLDADVDTRLALTEDVLRLAAHANVHLKCSAIPELSRNSYPFDDLWPLLRRFIRHFGAERMMWGSDINQHRQALTYQESIDYLRLSNELASADRDQLLGGTALRLLHAPALSP